MPAEFETPDLAENHPSARILKTSEIYIVEPGQCYDLQKLLRSCSMRESSPSNSVCESRRKPIVRPSSVQCLFRFQKGSEVLNIDVLIGINSCDNVA